MKLLLTLVFKIACLSSLCYGQESEGFVVKITRMADKEFSSSVGQGLAFIQKNEGFYEIFRADSTRALEYETCDLLEQGANQILGQRKPELCIEIEFNDEIYFIDVYPSRCSSCFATGGYGLFTEMNLETNESIYLHKCTPRRLRLNKKELRDFFEGLLEDQVLK